MAKKTSKPAHKAAPKTKPVTMAERVRRIELDVNRHGANMAAITAAMREQLDRIESKVSDDAAFRLFVQSLVKERNEQVTAPVEIKVPEEQGLEPGDYCSGTPEELKEVADELTAMGWGWYDSDRCEHKFIVRMNREADCAKMINTHIRRYGHDKRLPRPEFLSRAAVTAKELGLVPVEQPKPWKPEVGEWVVVLPPEERIQGSTGSTGHYPAHATMVKRIHDADHVMVDCGPCSGGPYCDIRNLRPATPEEIAKHKEQAELAKPIVPYETRVMWEGDECKVLHGPDVQGYYLLHALGTAETLEVKRNEFTVIP